MSDGATRRSPTTIRLILGAIALVAACGAKPVSPRLAARELPSLDRWRQHVTDELLPFWTTPDALGTPVGNFPTFRCNDGTVHRAESPCPELSNASAWISTELARDYTRMKSRQTFLYGAAFHITGEERYLEYARAGVAWLREHAYERDTGSAVTYWENGQPGPPPDQRTTQDLAYAQLGLAFYYYLTRDPEVLADLVALERHIMTRYWDPSPSGGMLRWVNADGATPGDALRQELVSQLDQINAYMLLLAPLLEDDQVAQAWQKDMLQLARVVKERFFAPEHGMFYGTVHDPAAKKLGSRHTDFGHSMKSLWMLYLVGQRTGERDLVDFARPLVAPLLARAAQPSGCWASEYSSRGTIQPDSQWWIFAELDQAAATLAGREPSAEPYARYLAKSYDCWFTRFVDHKNHDVWPFVPADWTEHSFDAKPPAKLHHWKNGYHPMEHALVAMITTAGLTGQALPLYYAFVKAPPRARIQPYYFSGTIIDDRDHPLPQHPALHGHQIVYRDLH